MNAQDIAAAIDEPAFSVDHHGRIRAWNAAMTRLFALDRGEVLGHQCHKVMGGLDSFGNRYCGENCPVKRMARRREPIHRFKLTLQTAQCRCIRAWVSVIALPGAGRTEYDLIHLLSPVKKARRSEDSFRDSAAAEVPRPSSGSEPYAPAKRRLTRRELELLELLAAGEGTKEISELLFISPHTVRNHIQSILGKLGAHSRLEAISIARRLGLLG